jgi:isopentenyl-diphosphate delta-isomerase
MSSAAGGSRPEGDLVPLHEPIVARFAGEEGSIRLTALSTGGARAARDGLETAPDGVVELDLAGPDGPIRVGASIRDAGTAGWSLSFGEVAVVERERLGALLTRIRKEDHLRLCLGPGVSHLEVSSGFERYRIPHSALPEIDLDAVDLSTSFLGRRLRLPLLISSMTGGSDLAGRVNRNLAEAAQATGVALGLGSMRICLEDPSAVGTFAVRDQAPDVPIYANLGAVQLNYGVGPSDCARLVEMVEADGLILHLNPLQEAIQPGGDGRFSGLEERIGEVVAGLDVPVVAKEVGAGISGEVARRLVDRGIRAIDVAGASGTSWARIEGKRAGDPVTADLGELFGDWGIPTAEALVAARRSVPEVPLVASGGVRHAVEAAVAIALGANLVGIARPFLEAAVTSSEAVVERIETFARGLRIAMFVAGAPTIESLGRLRLERVDR